MSNTTPGREPIQIVEIVQHLCTRTYGVSPCTASGAAPQKCYNTRATCQDTANYDAGELSLYFGKGIPAEHGIVSYLIPSLVSISTSPTRINIAGASSDAQGLGNRALCSIVFTDHQHTDRIVDPYLSGRTWNPLDADRGTFWSRWLVRNKYWKNIKIIIHEGYAGESLAAMSSRTYFIDSISPPDAKGRVTIKGKDILARIEERKAQAPEASPGELYTDIDAAATTFVATGAVIGDYDASGTLRINDEIMTYTSRASVTAGVRFSGVTRGTDGSEANSHSNSDAIQQCLRYAPQRPDEAIEDLLTSYGGIATSYIPSSDWQNEVTTHLNLYSVNALITEPTSVKQLVAELAEQCCLYIWWDERDAEIKLRAIRGIDTDPEVFTDQANILADSLTLTEKPRERVSQVWIYYDQRDYAGADDEPASYARQYVLADLESEKAELYGEPSVRKLFSRWLSRNIFVQNTASKILARYRDIPSEIKFRVDAKDRIYWVGDTIEISHHFDVDQYGERRQRRWTIISAEEVIAGEVVEYTAEDTTLYGRLYYVMASGAADYPGYDFAPAKNCYIGNAAGKVSDGQDAGKIS